MLKEPACEQLTLVQSDISSIDIFVIKRIFITCSRICDIQQERIKKEIKSFLSFYSVQAIRIKDIQF